MATWRNFLLRQCKYIRLLQYIVDIPRICECLIGKDLEGRDHGVIEIWLWQLLWVNVDKKNYLNQRSGFPVRYSEPIQLYSIAATQVY